MTTSTLSAASCNGIDAVVLPEVVARAHFDHELRAKGGRQSEEPIRRGRLLAKPYHKVHGLSWTNDPRAHAAVLRRLAGVEMMLGNRRAALAAAASAFRLDPLGVSRALLRNRGLTAKIFLRFLRRRSGRANRGRTDQMRHRP